MRQIAFVFTAAFALAVISANAGTRPARSIFPIRGPAPPRRERALLPAI